MGASVDGVLRFVAIDKRFPGVHALSDVSLEVRAGEVHAVVGENGAGKSTLMAIAAGSLTADAGEVWIAGEHLDRPSAERARELGLAIVYQEPALLPDLTVAENIAIGSAKARRPGWTRARAFAAEALAPWSRNRRIDPALPVRELGPDVRFMVEISKALAQRPRVLILDEPTEHLAADDVEILFERIRSLSERGTAIVYISHRIPDVRAIADRISVLRDGVLQGTFAAADVTESDIVNRIVGRPLETAFPPKASWRDAAAPILSVQELSGPRFTDFSIQLRPGEIVGLAGVDGNGQREIIRSLAGRLPARGTVHVDGSELRTGSNAAAASAGLGYIPADRHAEGVFGDLGVRENVMVKALGSVAVAGFVQPGRERRAARERMQAHAIKAPSLETPMDSLSGGNQQKTVLARVLQGRPKVILADEPTQGVDVGARIEIYGILREAVADGAGALVVSSDGAELEGLCDRVMVVSRGQVVRELAGDELTEQNMTEAALTSTTSRGVAVTERRDSRLRRFLRGDLAPAAVLAAVIVALGAYTATQSEFYLTGRNFNGFLTLFAALAFVALAQQVVMLTGGIDLSVGPLAGFLLVVASFVLVDGQPTVLVGLGWLLLLVIAAAVAVLNWAPTVLGIPPFLTTLVTFTALQGLSLLLRPLPDGVISPSVTEVVSTSIDFFPVAAVVAIVLALLLEVALRRTTWGVQLRSVGSDPQAARDVGIPVRRVQLSAYLAAGVLVLLTAVMLIAQVGSGDPAAGTSFTLTSITAVVLGGASIFGGRGAFVGALLGALLIQQINTSTVFLELETAWQTYLLGILTLAAAGLYSRARGSSGPV
jgi:ribose transport system ATP-binding protein